MDDVNGKGDMLKWVLTLALAALVAYYTAQQTMQSQLNRVEEREMNHYGELLRRLVRIEDKLDR